jgi:hypothetical protein
MPRPSVWVDMTLCRPAPDRACACACPVVMVPAPPSFCVCVCLPDWQRLARVAERVSASASGPSSPSVPPPLSVMAARHASLDPQHTRSGECEAGPSRLALGAAAWLWAHLGKGLNDADADPND